MVASRLTKIPGEGSFVINRLRDEDEGVYECWASNDNGTAIDKQINFTKTCQIRSPLYTSSQLTCHVCSVINLMPTAVETVTVTYGDPFEKQCVPPSSVPKARAYWILTSGESAERRLFQTINYTNVALNADVSGRLFYKIYSLRYIRNLWNLYAYCY